MEEMTQLVEAHSKLEDPMQTAIWIRQGELEAWLVELVPAFPSDGDEDVPLRPFSFAPGVSFRYPLNLIIGGEDEIRAAIIKDRELAKYISNGEILCGPEKGRELKALADEVLNG